MQLTRTPRHAFIQQAARGRVDSKIIDHFKRETTTIKMRTKLTKNMTNATISLTASSAASRHHQHHHHQKHHHNHLHQINRTLASRSCSSRNRTSHLMLATIMLIMVQLAALVTLDAKSVDQYQVKFKKYSKKEISAAFGASVTLECEAHAQPPPTIHWLKDGRRIIQNELDENRLDDVLGDSAAPIDDITRSALSTTHSFLFLDCIDETDEATYTCVAENAYSRISTHSRLELIRPISVQADVAGDNELVSAEVAALSELKALDGAASVSAVPQCVSDRLQTGLIPRLPARIHMWTTNMAEIMKNKVVLMCRSNARGGSSATAPLQDGGNNSQTTAASRLTTSWTLPNQRVVSEDHKDKYVVLETGDLLIKDLSWSDLGSYVCTVSDDMSSDSVSTFLYPMAPGKPTTGRKRAGGSIGR